MKLPDDTEYKDIKLALLKRFNLTKHDYRKKFFSARPENEENMDMYIDRLKQYIDKWAKLSKTEATYEGLQELIISHIIYDSCNPKLTCFLLEREPETLSQITNLADKFYCAHASETLGAGTEMPYLANAITEQRGHELSQSVREDTGHNRNPHRFNKFENTNRDNRFSDNQWKHKEPEEFIQNSYQSQPRIKVYRCR